MTNILAEAVYDTLTDQEVAAWSDDAKLSWLRLIAKALDATERRLTKERPSMKEADAIRASRREVTRLLQVPA